jgi:hypothetical protein
MNVLRGLHLIALALVRNWNHSRFPGAMQRSSRCFAEPGTVSNTGVLYDPGSAAHRSALRCVRGTECFRFTENSSEGVAGNVSPTVHTGRSH